LFDAAVYKDGDSTTSFHAMIRNLATATKTAEPTPFHHLLATLAQEGRLLRLYTQNVDGIDTSLPPLASQIPLPKKGPWPKTVQLHGTLEHMTCTKCHHISEFNPDLFDGPSPPACQHCEETDGIRTQHAGKRSHGVGVLRPRMVLYNEHNPDDEAIGSVVKADMRTRPDALIVVGTTLKVPGVKRIVKEMCGIVRARRDGVTVWINNDPPPALKDYEWDLVVQGPCDHVASHAAMRRWDEPEPEEPLVSQEHIDNVKREKGTPEVVIMSPTKKNKTVDRVQGVITPAPSPKMKPLKTVNTGPSKGAKATAASKKQTTLAGAKRKAEEKPAATKKAPAAKKNASKQANNNKNSSGIRVSFKIGKPHLAPPAVKKPAKPQQQTPPHRHLRKKSSSHDTFSINPEVVIDVADSQEKSVDVKEYLQPLSPSSARNNGSPPYYSASLPTLSQKNAFRGVRKIYPELSVDTGMETPLEKESREERLRTVTPPSVPRGLGDLFS
jgi:NAD-dependent histone deacetylase SIR2